MEGGIACHVQTSFVTFWSAEAARVIGSSGPFMTMSYLVLWAQSTTKDYIRAEHKLHSISKLFISQVIIPQVMFFFSLFILRGHSTREPAFSRVTYLILRAYTGTMCWTQPTQEKIGRGFGEKCGWMDRKAEFSKEEIRGSKRSMYGYVLTFSRL